MLAVHRRGERSGAVNERLLRQVQQQILAEPASLHMGTFDCGTAACIAGHALRLSGNPVVNPHEPALHQRVRGYAHPWDVAREVLALTEDEAQRLFDADSWPQPFRIHFAEETVQQRAWWAAERIRHFIQTGGAE